MNMNMFFQNSLEEATKVQQQVSKPGTEDSTAAVAAAVGPFELLIFVSIFKDVCVCSFYIFIDSTVCAL